MKKYETSSTTVSTLFERRALLATLLATGIGSAWGAKGDNIVIGQTLSIGAGADGTASRIMDGAKACVGAVNARGGINGRQVELITLDGGRDPASHVKNARALVNENGAVALINISGDAICNAVAQAARELQVPLIGPMSTTPEMLHSRNRFQFPVRASNDKQAEALSRQMRTMGVSRAVILTDQPGRSERAESIKPFLIADRISATTLKVDPAKPETFDIALKAMGAISSLHAAVMDLQPETIDRLSELSLPDRPEWPRMLVSFASMSLIGLGGAFPGRIIGFANVVPNAESITMPLTQELNRDAEKYSTGHAVTFVGFEAYINTLVCMEGLRRVTGKPDSAKLTDALDKMGRIDLGGFVVSFAGRDTGSDWVDVGVRARSGHFLK
jgi:branched-chain amino acid transport system substrate-binding protein